MLNNSMNKQLQEFYGNGLYFSNLEVNMVGACAIKSVDLIFYTKEVTFNYFNMLGICCSLRLCYG